MLVALTTRIFASKSTVAALRLGALARALIAGGDRVQAPALCLALSVASDTCRFTDGSADVGKDSGLIEVRRVPILHDRTGAIRGYISHMSSDLSLIAQLLTDPHLDMVASEPPSTAGATIRIACTACRIPYVYCCTDIVSDVTTLAGVPSSAVRTVAGLESFALYDTHHVIAVSDRVAHRARDVGACDVAVAPNDVHVSETVAIGIPGELPTCGGPILAYAGTVAQ